jgi:hypothetical protein
MGISPIRREGILIILPTRAVVGEDGGNKSFRYQYEIDHKRYPEILPPKMNCQVWLIQAKSFS